MQHKNEQADNVLCMLCMYIINCTINYIFKNSFFPNITTFNSIFLLTDYSYGIFPRCFVGEIFSRISGFVPYLYFIYGMLIIYTLSFLSMTDKIYRLSQEPDIHNIILILNVILSGMVFSHSFFGRLDILMLSVMFCSITAILDKKYYLVPFLTILGCLIHEGYVVFCMLIPEAFIFINLLMLWQKDTPSKVTARKIIINGTINIILGISMYAYFRWGCHHLFDSNNAFNSFKETFAEYGFWGNIVKWVLTQEILGETVTFDTYSQLWCSKPKLTFFLITGIILLSPLFVWIYKKWVTVIKNTYNQNKKLSIMFLLLSFDWLHIIPCFIIHIDYGRWILFILLHIFFTIIAMQIYFGIKFTLPKNWIYAQSILSAGGTAFAINGWLDRISEMFGLI